MATEKEKTREHVIVFLLFLTSEESLKTCHKFIAPGKLAFQLARIWFDDIYLPGIRYLDGGFKGDYSEKAVAKFTEGFTQDEFNALERFHHFFELRLEMIPIPTRESGVWPQNDSWSNMIKGARNLLELFALDADALRCRICEIFRETLGKSLDIPDLRRIHSEELEAALTSTQASRSAY